MTDRGLSGADATPACPFVAFDDDRDARADRPDHRHRCFAEDDPAPRALAHQEAYCLSSAFPVCPTFQAWARREAAHARPGAAGTASTPDASRPASGAATNVEHTGADGPGPSEPEDAAPVDVDDERGTASAVGLAAGGTAGATTAQASAPSSSSDSDADEWTNAPANPPIESTPRRNPPRDWAAPPPWATGAGAGGARASTGSSRDDAGYRARSAEGAGLAGSAADRLASGESVSEAMRPAPPPPPSPDSRSRDLPSAGPDPDLAGLVGGAAVGGAASRGGPAAVDIDPGGPSYPPSTRSGGRRSVSSTRSSKPADRNRLPAHEPVQHDGPSWERARRYEAYPTIKTSRGLPSLGGLPRITVLAGALVIAAVALFFLPALLGIGGGGTTPSASPNPTEAVASASTSPTPEPAPTPQVYVIKQNDTLSRIAKRYGVTLEQLLAANKDTIKNPNRISVGDQIIIPVPVPVDVSGASASP